MSEFSFWRPSQAEDGAASRPELTVEPALLPWGFWATTGWAVLGFAAWLAAQLGIVSIMLLWWNNRHPQQPISAADLISNGVALSIVMIGASPVLIGVLLLAVRRAGWRISSYLCLKLPTRREFAIALLSLAVVLFASDATTAMLGREVTPVFAVDVYRSARDAGALPLLVVALVVVAPAVEEIAFRGFLFRGFAASRLGVGGAIMVTSALWAATHAQYDRFGIAQVFLIGLLLGTARWLSGSTMLTMVMHGLTNAAATLQAALAVEWLG